MSALNLFFDICIYTAIILVCLNTSYQCSKRNAPIYIVNAIPEAPPLPKTGILATVTHTNPV